MKDLIKEGIGDQIIVFWAMDHADSMMHLKKFMILLYGKRFVINKSNRNSLYPIYDQFNNILKDIS